MKKKYFNIFGKVVILIIVLSFILTGIFSGVVNYGQDNKYIYQIGEYKINQTEYEKHRTYVASVISEIDDMNAEILEQESLTMLHQTYAILNEAKQLNIKPTEQEIFQEISKNENFQKEGKFSKELYFDYLKFYGIKASDLEEEVEKGLMRQKYVKLKEKEAEKILEMEDFSFLEKLEPVKMIEYTKEDRTETISLLEFKEKYDIELEEVFNESVIDEENDLIYRIFKQEQDLEKNILSYKIAFKYEYLYSEVNKLTEKFPLIELN